MPSFTQSDLDEVLNGLFKADGIFELAYRNCTWYAWCANKVPANGATPAEAIRKATIALVAERLSQ